MTRVTLRLILESMPGRTRLARVTHVEVFASVSIPCMGKVTDRPVQEYVLVPATDRKMDANRNLLPNFLVIGTAKAGTTALHGVLKKHPEIFLPFKKELHFFNDDANYARGVDWYVGTFFGKSGGYSARGDITPTYLYWGEKVVPRIQGVYETRIPRMIVILRDPVERAYSRYWHQRRVPGREPLSFEEALNSEDRRLAEDKDDLRRRGRISWAYFQGGLYAAQLGRYFQCFPRERFHVMLFDDLKKDFVGTIRCLLRFLEVDPTVEVRPLVGNPASVPRAAGLNRWLRSHSRLGRAVKETLSPRMLSYVRKAMRRPFLRPASYPPIDSATERALRLRYRPDIQQLEAMLDRDLSHWYLP